MITTTDRRNVSSTLTGETRAFTIAASAKAFRGLVDSLYSDKVGSIVRELTSNAFDAHRRRGNEDVPFEVRLPNNMNPTFSVRDYGCSMDHDTVMGIYSTLFESTKTTTNNEVGSFGLGAKSFLAYTDACTVICWLDGEIRSYSVSIGSDGIPSITLVHRAPSKEQQGVEVTFAIKPNDARLFSVAFSEAALGFTVPPTVVGGSITVPKPVFEGPSWRVYKNTDVAGATRVRQGCAVYQDHSLGRGTLPHGYVIILDTPIGSVDVTMSREALAMTHTQRQLIVSRLDSACEGVHDLARAQYHALPTLIEKARFAQDNLQMLGRGHWPTWVMVDDKHSLVKFTGDDLKWDLVGAIATGTGREMFNGTFNTRFEVDRISGMRILVDDGSKLVRRMKRLRALASRCQNQLWVTTSLATAKHCQKILDMKDSQILEISQIPDYPPLKRTSMNPPVPRKVATSTRVWALCDRDTTTAGVLTWSRRGSLLNQRDTKWLQMLVTAVQNDKAHGNEVLYLTKLEHERAVKKGTINPDNRIDLVVTRYLDGFKDQARLKFERVAFTGMSHEARVLLLDKVGLGDSNTTELPEVMSYLFQVLFPAEVVEYKRGGARKAQMMASKYPLLFGRSKEAMQAYMKFCETA